MIQQIRGGATTIAQSLSEATVILIDLVGFTALSRKLSPAHLVEVLSDLFRAFDEQSERCGVSKIKTIGDATWQQQAPQRHFIIAPLEQLSSA